MAPDISQRDAGTSLTVVRLARELSKSQSVELHTNSKGPADSSVATFTYPTLRLFPQLGVSPQLKSGIAEAASTANILHFHGMWNMASVYPGKATRQSRCALFFSPHGMLEPWALQWHRYRKRVFSLAFQRRAIRGVDCIHATSHGEAESIRSAGYDNPIAVIPIGVDVPPERTAIFDPPLYRTLLYMGRLHPKKNVEALMQSWRRLPHHNEDWRLVIAGSGDLGYVDSLQAMAADLPRVVFTGSVFGDEKEYTLATADLLILPTYSENFGIVVAEALSRGVPVVTTEGTPWAKLDSTGSGWWIPIGADHLTLALEEAMSLSPQTLARMGTRGRAWMASDFAWSRVTEMMIATYKWIARGGTTPDWMA